MINYTHGALSTNDPSNVPIKYSSREEAQAHADFMNSIRITWQENPTGLWNKDHWKEQPEPWVVVELK